MISATLHDYNESLIERGRVLMDIGFLRSWNKEIKRINQGKVGALIEYSPRYIHFLAFRKIAIKVSYRTIQRIEYIKMSAFSSSYCYWDAIFFFFVI